MSKLVVSELSASASGTPLLNSISLEINSGEVHAIMGPNGSGKSTLSNVLVGRSGYEITSGSIEIDGISLAELPPDERARLGLFSTQQYPIEIPGVTLLEMLAASLAAKEEAVHNLGDGADSLSRLIEKEAISIGMDKDLIQRTGINVDLSGGESKRSEALQLAVLKPRFAILDELDSGLDVDAMEDIGRRLQKSVLEDDLGVLAITHYPRLLDEMPASYVHILVEGEIVESGGPELARVVEEDGYARFEILKDVSVDIRLN